MRLLTGVLAVLATASLARAIVGIASSAGAISSLLEGSGLTLTLGQKAMLSVGASRDVMPFAIATVILALAARSTRARSRKQA